MTDETFDFQDGNGPVPAARHKNPDGVDGGWVANTARVSGDARVSSSYAKATRSDGYEFAVFETHSGFAIVAGCRYFETWKEAEAHWFRRTIRSARKTPLF